MTARPSSAGDPPDATSWLSWYWAKRASASRCAWSKALRYSRSSAASRPRRRSSSGSTPGRSDSPSPSVIAGQRDEDHEAGHRARIEMARGALAEPEGQSALRDERSGGPYAGPRGGDRGRDDGRTGPTVRN